MEEQLKSRLGLESKQGLIGEKAQKKSLRLWKRSKRTYRVIWASTLGQLETEVTKFLQNQQNVELIGRPFHDLSWWQALTYTEKN